MTDVLFVLAVLLIATGAGLVYLPAGLISAGVVLLASVAFLGTRRRPGAEA